MYIFITAFLAVSAQAISTQYMLLGNLSAPYELQNWDQNDPESEWYRGLCYCGQRQNNDIIDGTEVKDLSKYPWMVFIRSPLNETVAGKCTGALISPTAILTAAHCNTEEDPSNTVVGQLVPGSKRRLRRRFNVRKIINHPEFNITAAVNDIAIWLLSRPVTCGKDLMPICLPNENLETVGAITIIAGYGYSNKSLPVSDSIPVLREGEARILEGEVCRHSDPLKSQSICLQGVNNTLPCYGDSGGPLVQMKKDGLFFSLGVLSGTNYELCEYYSTFWYQSAFHHRSFIEQHVKDLSPPPPGWLRGE